MKKIYEIKTETTHVFFSPSSFLRRAFAMSVDNNFENTIHWDFENTADYIKKPEHAFLDKELNKFVAIRTYSGKGELHLANKVFPLETDSLIFFSHHQKRKHLAKSDYWEFDWFEFYISEPFFPLEQVLSFAPNKSELACRKKVLKLQSHSPNAPTVQGAFSYLLTIWATFCQKKNAAYSFEIEKIVAYINNNLDKKLSIDDLAKQCHLSSRYFRKIFIDNIGIPPSIFIENKRLEKCTQLLQNTNMTLSQIAEATGMTSQYYLSIRFKKKFCISPIEYKRTFSDKK